MRRSVYIHLAVLAVLIVMPQLAHAASTEFFGPIFPRDICSCVGSAPGWGCVLQVFQNVLNAFVSFSIIGISIYIAYAGFQFILNPTNEEKRTQARQGFTNAIIGLFIVLGAWLLVDSVMKVLYDGTGSKFGPWNTILASDGAEYCLEVRAPGQLPGVSVTDPKTQVDIATGGTGNVTVVKGKATFSSGQAKAVAGVASSYHAQLCAAAVQNNISGQGNVLAGVLAIESSGNPRAHSPAGAYGLMQLMPSTAGAFGVAACKGASNSNPSAACVNALYDPQTNINAGVKYFSYLYKNTHGNLDNAIASYNGGLKASEASHNCPGTTAWQCTVNKGYAETRRYVPNVEAVAQQSSQC